MDFSAILNKKEDYGNDFSAILNKKEEFGNDNDILQNKIINILTNEGNKILNLSNVNK